MSALAVLVLALAAGYALGARRLRGIPGAGKAPTAFVVYLALPAVILDKVHGLAREGIQTSWLLPASMAYLAFAATVAVVVALGRSLGWGRPVVLSLCLTVGFSNTSFVGYPLVEALYGAKGLAIAVLVDQPGSFFLLATVAPLLVALGGGSPFRRGALLRSILVRLVAFPPTWALAVAAATARYSYPGFLGDALSKLGVTLGPVALFAVGVELGQRRVAFRGQVVRIAFGVGWKLFLTPALCVVVYRWLLKAPSDVASVVVVEAATAPMITSTLLAMEADLAPELAGAILAVGIPLSLVTVPLWALALR